ncbi:MAG: adenylate/guanylate cyclase domain-containing protein [Candidatus Cybelea sp.]
MALRAPLPSGTVTLLFTDIEGSTQHWEQQRATMPEALRRHDDLLRTAIESHGGYVFKTMGDQFCAAFSRASDAVAAAADAQRGLAAEDWSAVGGLAVRMALHSGITDEREDDYFGPVVNRVARLLAVAHGGQVIVSGSTAPLLRGVMPERTELRDLGAHRLKDLIEPEYVWQLSIETLRTEFPALQSLDARPDNLPIQRTSFVGREYDIADVTELLTQHRLLTLVGSGGVGKTRLALQVGAELLDRYPDGVWFVDLAPISDTELVASVTAQALGMSQQQGRRIDEAIPHWLKRKKLLIIFDNCEHVLERVAQLASSILTTAPEVRVLATSRQPLGIAGEAAHRLPSLPLPADVAGLTADEALRYGAIALFTDRATATDTRFALTDSTARVVAEICHRLDGIPLAIELAAARVKVLSIPNLAQRLDERFRILTGGSRDVLPRQKTLHALIDWSYDLLTPQEQLLFARLGVFAGGFGLDAATDICGGEGLDEIDTLDLLASLTDKSLIVADTSGEHERYRLLESTAAYALEKLSASGEREALARRHAEHFRDEALASEERSGTGSRFRWLAGMELELDNYRTALEWALTQGNDAALGGAIAGAFPALWTNAGLAVEGRYWISLALERASETEQPRIVANLWHALSGLSPGQRRHDAAEQAIRLYASVGDARGTARAQRQLAFALMQMGQFDEAKAANEQALATARACGDARNVAFCLDMQASITRTNGEVGAVRELYAQALAAFRALGDESGIAIVLGNLAELEFAEGHPDQALHAGIEALEIHARGKNAIDIATGHSNNAAYRIALGDLAAAGESARNGLRVARQARVDQVVAIALQHFALLAGLGGDARRGAQLLGYVDVQYAALGMHRDPTEKWGYDKLMAALHEALGANEIAQLAAEGAAWSEDQAVEEALKV